MLRIQSSQLNHFAEQTRDRFASLMTNYIAESFPAHARALRDTPLPRWVRDALRVCERYGVDTEPEAAQLMLILLVTGLHAAAHESWIRDAVGYDGAPAGKVRRLVDACRQRGLAIEDVLVFREFRGTVVEEA